MDISCLKVWKLKNNLYISYGDVPNQFKTTTMKKDVLKTKASVMREVKRLKFIKRALTGSLVGTKGDERVALKEEIEKLSSEIEFLRSEKYFLYNFKTGGWNSSSGVSIADAIKKEKKRWKGSGVSDIDESSFRIRTESEERSLLSLFY